MVNTWQVATLFVTIDTVPGGKEKIVLACFVHGICRAILDEVPALAVFNSLDWYLKLYDAMGQSESWTDFQGIYYC